MKTTLLIKKVFLRNTFILITVCVIAITLFKNSVGTVTFTNIPYGATQESGHKGTLEESSRQGVDDDITTRYSHVENVVQQRLQKVRDFCVQNIKVNIWENLKPTGQVWSSMNHDIHYCLTPKIGCTYWKQVMRFIAGDYNTNLNISKPGDIDRNYVHYGNLKYIRHVGLESAMARGEMSKGRSFMFTREPYGRLWSAYIDKFLLPDFWRSDAHAVVNQIRLNATDEQRLCANDVTFTEFLQYIVASFPRNLNEHWQPVYKICDPCLVAYDVIGKQETFANDSNYIMQKVGLGNLIPMSGSKSSRAIEEITMLVKYNFDLERAIHKGCFDKEDVAKRLWKAFQYNGYIHRSIDIPFKSMHSDNFTQHPTEVFVKHALWTLQYQHDQTFDISNQKRNMMLEAYRSVPVELVKSIQEVYKFDFELFGYDKNSLDEV
ncbi:carbohydrate sulfotransferase 11-like isoform X1 [Mya arenaria]|uniref:carbohydrate sulfotransferase 11-like isoform X1 n=1 Tax=Mya arenaria TaxID=6604 RepID=UPI0022E53BBD|nr:carbohydrate sulfotransferase 11-like isoform X1 [Mya arenaria]